MKKIIVSIILALMIVINGLSIVATSDKPSDWATQEIEALKAANIGISNEMFSRYKESITRRDFTYLIYKLFNKINDKPLEELAIEGLDVKFSDTDDYYILSVGRAGIIAGMPDGTFRPNDLITREQMARIFINMIKVLNIELDYEIPDSLVFNDEGKISNWALQDVKVAFKHEILRGEGNMIINPLGNATREACLLLVYRIYNNPKYRAKPNALGTSSKGIQDNTRVAYYVNQNTINQVEFANPQLVYRHSRTIESFLLNNDMLYFKDNNADLYSVHISGNNVNKLANVEHYTIGRQYLYYVSKGSLMRSSLDGKYTKKLLDLEGGCSEFVFYRDMLYMNINNEVFVYDLENQKVSPYNLKNGKNISFVGEYVYWQDIDTHKLSRMNLKGENLETFEIESKDFQVREGEILYFNEGDQVDGYPIVYRYEIGKDEKQPLNYYSVERFSVSRNYVLMNVILGNSKDVYVWRLNN